MKGDIPNSEQHQPSDAMKRFTEQLNNASFKLGAMNAMGAMIGGDIEQVCISLGRIPVDRLSEIAVAAAALSSLAEEIAVISTPRA